MSVMPHVAAMVAGAGLLLLLADLYFLPAVIAWLRGHPQRFTIFAFNLVFGWTLLGWGFGLLWALPADRADAGLLRSAAFGT